MSNTAQLRSAVLLTEGKTKRIYRGHMPGTVVVVSKSDITAGDGAKHDVMEGKARWANETTCNVFDLLKARKIPLAYMERIDDVSFLASECTMIPLEVVVRRKAFGSYLKRYPSEEKGARFPNLVVELFLKTKNRQWGTHLLQSDDPFLIYDRADGIVRAYAPDQELSRQQPFPEMPMTEILNNRRDPIRIMSKIEEVARGVFLLLERAWERAGAELVDFKIEFGVDQYNRLLLADVIDNDSWRVLDKGGHLDKQLYRDGSDLMTVAEKYRAVAEITKSFVSL